MIKIINSLLAIAGISVNRIPDDVSGPENNNNFNPNLKFIIQQIISPIENQLKILVDNLENNLNDNGLKNLLKYEIIKAYLIHKEILSTLKRFSNALTNLFLKEHLNNTLNITTKIFQIFSNDKELINAILEFYDPNAEQIGEICKNNAAIFNNLLLNYFLASDLNYNVIEILVKYYKSLLVPTNNNEIDCQNNKYIMEQYYIIMNKFIDYVKNGMISNKDTKEKIKIFSDFHYKTFPKLYINTSPLINNETILKFLELIKKIIQVLFSAIDFLKNKENTEPVIEITIISLIKSFNIFFNNNSFPKQFLNENNLIYQMVISIWNVVSFKQFNRISREELSIYLINLYLFNKYNFYFIFSNCLSQSDKYNNKYIESIMEYIKLFGDDKTKLKKIIQTSIEVVQGNEGLESLTVYFLCSAQKKLKKVPH